MTLRGRRHAVAAWLIVAAAVLLPLLTVPIGALDDRGDEAYQAMCVRFYDHSPLAMLSFWVGHVWTGIFGETVFALRMLRWLCIELSAAIGCLYLYRCTRRLLLTAVTFGVAVLASEYGDADIYNWDTGPMVFEAMGLVGMCAYMHRPSALRATLLGALTALMAASRLPLAAMAVLMVAVIAVWRFRERHSGHALRNALSDTVLFALAAILTALACTYIMTGGPAGFIAAFNPDNIITNHTELSRFVDYFNLLLPWAVDAWVPMFGVAAAATAYMLVRRRRVAVFVGLSVLLFLFYRYFSHFYYQYVELRMLGFSFPLFVVTVCALPAARQPGSGRQVRFPVPLWAIIVFQLLIPFGSDQMFFHWTVAFTLPVALVYVYPAAGAGARRFLRVFLALALVSLLSIVLLFIRRGYSLYDRPGDDMPGNGPVTGSTQTYDYMTKLCGVVDSLSAAGCNVHIVGQRYAPLYVLTDTLPALRLHNYHFYGNSSDDAETLRRSLGGADAVILSRRDFTDDHLIKKAALCIEMLERQGFVRRECGRDEGFLLYQR